MPEADPPIQPPRFSRARQKLYAYLLAASVIVRLPWWVITNLTPWQRPRKSWTLHQALEVELVRWLFDDAGQHKAGLFLKTPTHEKLEDRFGGIWVEAVPSELVKGKLKEWATKAKVEPVRIPGYWIHESETEKPIAIAQKPESKEEKVLYFLHGGAYVSLSAHPDQAVSIIPKRILETCPSVKRSFAVEYRLTSIPPEPTKGQFPSALLDALSGYVYLVDRVGISPDQIIIVGDSAGGNLAQALVRYLSEYKEAIPNLPRVPGSLILLSPWVDMSGSHHSATSSAFTNSKSDYLPTPPYPYFNDAQPTFVEPFSLEFAFQTPYLSPACKQLTDVSFIGFPKTFIAEGDGEVLLDQVREFAQRIKGSLGEEKIVYWEVKDAFHDFLALDSAEPWKSQTLEAISRFIGNETSED